MLLDAFAVTMRYGDIVDESDLRGIRRLVALATAVREWVSRSMQ